MTIETASAQNTSRPAAADARPARGKQGGSDDAGGGGFSAILASVEPAQPPRGATGGASDAPQDGSVSDAMARLKLRARTQSADQAAQAGQTVSDNPADPIEGKDPMVSLDTDGAAALLAADQAARAAQAVLAGAGLAAQPQLPVDAAALLAQSPLWSTPPVTDAANAANALSANPGMVAGAGTNAITGAGPARQLPIALENAEGATAAAATGGELSAALLGKAAKMPRDAALTSVPTATALSAADAGAPAGGRVLPATPRTADQVLAPMAAALAMASATAPGRREDASRERSVFRSGASEGTLIAQPFQTTPLTTPVQSVQDANLGADIYVAEKVAYWITNDVQNAELKLDGIGAKAVEVSIRMQGNEAHVAFRTDELQARAALENASVHLKELLQREGLVLSGVSVGTAGAGESGAQERRNREGARHSVLGSVQSAPADARAVSARVGALDLFV